MDVGLKVKKMEQNKLKDLLEQVTEQPSNECWSGIESRLDVLFPTDISQSAMNSGPTGASPSGSFLSKIAAAPLKAAAIIGSIAVVSVVTILTIQTFTKPENITTVIPKVSETTPVITPVDTLISIEVTDPVPSKKVKNLISDKTNKQELNIVSAPINVAPQPNLPVTATPTPVLTEIRPTQTSTEKPVSNVQPITNPDPIIQNQDIPITIPVKITIPNVFTPNGDGYNDTFVIEGIEDCSEHNLIIKNSNGKIIFQSSDYQNDWNGMDCPDGVYIYYFFYKVNAIEEKMLGRVIIKR